MRTKALTSAALIVPFIAVVALAANGGGPEARRTMSNDCSVSTTDTVPIGLKSTILKARYTEMIGDSITATFPPASMITVAAVAHSTMDSPPSAEITLNTERAVPGKWHLSLKGDRGTCVGEVPVARKVAKQ